MDMENDFMVQCMDILNCIYIGYSTPDHLSLGSNIPKHFLNDLIKYLSEKELILEINKDDILVEYTLTKSGIRVKKEYERILKFFTKHN